MAHNGHYGASGAAASSAAGYAGARMTSAGVRFLTTPRAGPYGHVAVFADIAGNTWDLIGPAPEMSAVR